MSQFLPTALSPGASDSMLSVGIVLFDGLTQLDLTGAYEVLARMPNTRVYLVAERAEAVRSEWGLRIVPDATFESAHARYVTSVCSGSLLLGAAGLLHGYRATTHWMSLELLAYFGATPTAHRVVRDGDRITGAGVTSGIDYGLVVAAELFGDPVAQRIQLAIEYQPDPPFDNGTPHTAPMRYAMLCLMRVGNRVSNGAQLSNARQLGCRCCA